MEPVGIDERWWSKLPKEEQKRIIELVNREYYIGREQVRMVHQQLTKGYSNLHH